MDGTQITSTILHSPNFLVGSCKELSGEKDNNVCLSDVLSLIVVRLTEASVRSVEEASE